MPESAASAILPADRSWNLSADGGGGWVADVGRSEQVRATTSGRWLMAVAAAGASGSAGVVVLPVLVVRLVVADRGGQRRAQTAKAAGADLFRVEHVRSTSRTTGLRRSWESALSIVYNSPVYCRQ